MNHRLLRIYISMWHVEQDDLLTLSEHLRLSPCLGVHSSNLSFLCYVLCIVVCLFAFFLSFYQRRCECIFVFLYVPWVSIACLFLKLFLEIVIISCYLKGFTYEQNKWITSSFDILKLFQFMIIYLVKKL